MQLEITMLADAAHTHPAVIRCNPIYTQVGHPYAFLNRGVAGLMITSDKLHIAIKRGGKVRCFKIAPRRKRSAT